ncbi:protein AF1q [Denticeps clupeoides]|uniref:Protein AF1q n=1 Tax=Denticeps clupeoides TaxID=299321 RepID=A0AAY4BY35_9TELE|nr:protein AF1q [Denticeps clupeoides]
MLETSNSQYDAFLYWRQPIPALDLSELQDLGLSEMTSHQNIKSSKKQKAQQMNWERDQGVDDLLEYSTFNYWREPIACIDTLDFNLLL